ncbi:MAG TPA: nitroreductase family protein [Holophagaceae bacterium]
MVRALVLRPVLFCALLGGGAPLAWAPPVDPPGISTALPAPAAGPATLDGALKARRTTRELGGPALSRSEAAQLLWSAQGENRPGRRTVPSAHASYPLGLYLVTEGSPTLAAGTYRYRPAGHVLRATGTGGVASLLGPIRGMQPWIAKAPSVFVITGKPLKIFSREPAPSMDYTFWECGAASQALLLQAAALDLGAGTASGVDLAAVGRALGLPPEEKALVLLPVGRMPPGR